MTPEKKIRLRRDASDTLRVTVGSLIAATGFRYLTFPNSIVSGGITGIAQILNLLINTPVGVMIIVMNIPLFLWAWKKLGHRFVLLSLLCMLVNSVAVDLLVLFPLEITHDPLLAAVYGGTLNGFGYGLVYTTGATGGGMDIPARFLRRKYPHINYSTFVMGLSAVIVIAFAVIFKNFESCMYTVICMFIANKVEALLLYGPINSRLCYIISEHSDELRQAITKGLGRGATLLRGTGAWSGQDKQIILCVVKPTQIANLRKLVRDIDGQAFLIVSDARSVYGRGFEDLRAED